MKGSAASLVTLLILNWTFAMFGEDLADRIVLMRGISFALCDTRKAQISALALQALLFGLVHAHQGPAGIVGPAVGGLVFGCLTLASRWSIWPAVLARGANNTLGIMSLCSK